MVMENRQSICVNVSMLIEAYIEALLVDEELADLVWELWNARLIPDDVAAWAWCILVASIG